MYPTPTDLWRWTEKSQKRKEQNLSPVWHQQLRHIPCYHGYNKEISTDFHLSIIALHLLHKFIHTTKWKWLISYANVMNTKRSQKTLCHIHSIQLIHIKSLWQEWMGLCVRVMNFPWITFTENNFAWVTLVPLKERQQLNVSENHSERNLCQQSDTMSDTMKYNPIDLHTFRNKFQSNILFLSATILDWMATTTSSTCWE